MRKTFIVRVLTLLLLSGFFSHCSAQEYPPKYEFRAAWITSVNNIDWPSKAGLSTSEQKNEFISLVKKLKFLGFNSVVMQIRPSSDAFYKSSYDPWSRWLTGTQGKAPKPYYDPLEFMIKVCHNMDMEFHAWVNPFRGGNINRFYEETKGHITKKKPHWFITYNSTRYLNPGIPEARRYLLNVMTEIVENYDIDGLHFDDYFYPYPVPGQVFKDRSTYYKYKGKFKNMGDWRRNNVNLVIESVAKMIKEKKPFVKFGISPFAVWREYPHKHGVNVSGNNCSYDHQFADVRLWLKKHWIDYVAPQIYFSRGYKRLPYKKMARWWTKNTFGRHLYIGHATYKMNHSTPSHKRFSRMEIVNQILFNRNNGKINGSIHYSMKPILKHWDMYRDTLKRKVYNYTALTPPMPWKDKIKPLPPTDFKVSYRDNKAILSWNLSKVASDGDTSKYFIIYKYSKKHGFEIKNPKSIVKIIKGDQTSFHQYYMEGNKDVFAYAITSIDKMHNESEPILSEEKESKVPSLATKKKLAPIPEIKISGKHPEVSHQDALHLRKIFDEIISATFR